VQQGDDQDEDVDASYHHHASFSTQEELLYKHYHNGDGTKQHRDHNNYDGKSYYVPQDNHNDLTLTNLMTQMILHKTANHANKIHSIKDTIKSNHSNDLFQQQRYKKNDDVMKQQNSNKVMMMMMTTQAEQEMTLLMNTSLPSPTTEMNDVSLSQNQKGKYNSYIDFSPKSIINDNDNNEGSSLSNTIKKPMTTSVPSDSTSNSNSLMMMMMTKPLPPQVQGLSYYDPKYHFQDYNYHHESDHVFELDL
jgi:hypothetical protein